MHLHIQQRKFTGEAGFDADPAAVSRWVKALPMANSGETTRRLYHALGALNHLDLPAPQRFRDLEQLRPPLFYVLEIMKKHVVGQSLPLNEKAGKIARLRAELLRAMGDGYKLVVLEQVSGHGSRRDTRILNTALHRAMHCLVQQLLVNYQVYGQWPAHVWSDIHRLYRYAETQDLHRFAVEDMEGTGQATCTIEDLYRQILLLTLACPYRMRHGEAEAVYNRLARWAPHARLTAPPEGGQDTAVLFMANLDSDEPPTYLSLHHGTLDPAHCRLLDTAGLAEDVRAALAEAHQKPGGELSENALRRLMLAWGVMPKRRFSRRRQSARVSVAMGLSATHYFVSGEAVFSPAEGDLTRGPGREHPESGAGVPDMEPLKPSEAWELEPVSFDQHTPIQPTRRHAVTLPADLGENDGQSTFHAHDWHMINVSAGGYCLLWDSTENSRAQVGELVGIREHDDPDAFHWRLGTIRWMKSATGLELGVQMLSPGAVAVGARPYPATSREPRYSRCLLLPEITALEQPATLLMTAPPFRVGGTAIISSHGREVKVRLTRQMENTGSYAQFQFETLEEHARTDKPAPGGEQKPEEQEFEEVWTLL